MATSVPSIDVHDLKRGHAPTVRKWYGLYASKLHSFFGTRVKQEADCDELVHDTFLSCLASLPLYRGECALWTWMMGIARHELMDYYRKLYAKKAIALLPLGEQFLDSLKEEPLKQQYVIASLAKLPKQTAELLSLKYIDNLSVEAIARNLALTPHAVQSKLYRARELFKKTYEEVSNL